MATLLGGDKLEKVLAEIGRNMSGSVKVGFMSGATYPDGTPVPQVAFWNEFGTSRIPPRPFFRTMIANESPGWSVLIGRAAKEYDYNAGTVLKFMGDKISEQLQQSIVGWQDPQNSPVTVALKGFNKPLVDTGQMQNSIDYEVEE